MYRQPALACLRLYIGDIIYNRHRSPSLCLFFLPVLRVWVFISGTESRRQFKVGRNIPHGTLTACDAISRP